MNRPTESGFWVRNLKLLEEISKDIKRLRPGGSLPASGSRSREAVEEPVSKLATTTARAFPDQAKPAAKNLTPKKCCAMGSYECQVTMPLNGRTQGIDYCISDIVAALNAANLPTVASCCGHGKMPGVVSLADGREISLKGHVLPDRMSEQSAAQSEAGEDEVCPHCEYTGPSKWSLGVWACPECYHSMEGTLSQREWSGSGNVTVEGPVTATNSNNTKK